MSLRVEDLQKKIGEMSDEEESLSEVKENLSKDIRMQFIVPGGIRRVEGFDVEQADKVYEFTSKDIHEALCKSIQPVIAEWLKDREEKRRTLWKLRSDTETVMNDIFGLEMKVL